MDCLIVIGTALETHLASKIVGTALENKADVIEINPQPCIQFGPVKQLIGNAENIVPELSKEIILRILSGSDSEKTSFFSKTQTQEKRMDLIE